jgi:DNA repair protein RadD
MGADSLITLRYYQKEAREAFDKYLKKNKTGNGVIVLPTAAGKSYVLADQIKQYAGVLGARVMLLTHSKKLVQQDYDSTVRLWPEGKKLFGINSDGLGRRDTKEQVLFCGIQSIYKKAEEIGKVNFLVIDEAQRVNIVTSVQYKKFIKDMLEINPKMRVCGLTATPFRMASGLIYGPSSDLLFDDLVYRANTKELMAQGYLAKPITPSISKENRADNSGIGIKTTGGFREYDDKDLDSKYNVSDLIRKQMTETLEKCQGLNSIAVFAVNISHAENIASELRRRGESVAVVHSQIEEDDEKLIKQFENQEVRFLISVNMFVEGFDCPNIQAIVDIKPTLSPGRYVQMYGRGFRLCPAINKTTFLVLDFAGNIGQHGPVDQVVPEDGEGEKQVEKRPKKHCEYCGMAVHAKFKICPYCGWIFPTFESHTEEKTNAFAANQSVISEPVWMDVTRLHCSESRNSPAIVAHYYCGTKKFTKEARFDSEGIEWLKMHLGDDLPFDLKNFFNGGFRSKMKKPQQIFVDDAGAASKILEYKF